MRSTSRGAPSGVWIGPFMPWVRSRIFSIAMHVVRPRSFCRMNSMTAWASFVESTTMASSMPQAVDTATSYFFGIVPRSPRRPWTPRNLPAFDASYTARINLPRVCSSSTCDFASSAFWRVTVTSFVTSSICLATACRRDLASEVSFTLSSLCFPASLASCSRVFKRDAHSTCCCLSSSIWSATWDVFSRRKRASSCATDTTFCTSVKRC
mmetsp:Transcript_50633/g.147260  ORF Transcript_50633/g.147260 Transcript_50633/m.147260 type:complete len:210 (+) Transcript_50633:2253-2882(+)